MKDVSKVTKNSEALIKAILEYAESVKEEASKKEEAVSIAYGNCLKSIDSKKAILDEKTKRLKAQRDNLDMELSENLADDEKAEKLALEIAIIEKQLEKIQGENRSSLPDKEELKEFAVRFKELDEIEKEVSKIDLNLISLSESINSAFAECPNQTAIGTYSRQRTDFSYWMKEVLRGEFDASKISATNNLFSELIYLVVDGKIPENSISRYSDSDLEKYKKIMR